MHFNRRLLIVERISNNVASCLFPPTQGHPCMLEIVERATISSYQICSVQPRKLGENTSGISILPKVAQLAFAIIQGQTLKLSNSGLGPQHVQHIGFVRFIVRGGLNVRFTLSIRGLCSAENVER